MKQVSSFEDIERYLSQFSRPIDIKSAYSLDAIRAFLKEIGDPQESVHVIHVAGTSGKTSTVHYIAALLVERGYKVGLSVSPQVDSIAERAQINLQNLPEVEFITEFRSFMGLVTKSPARLSYFEILVAFAYWLFAKANVDYVVMEVGLGGLLDGTNVVTNPSKVAVITDIGFDHTEILGKTLREIAAQKAGIIMQGNHVVMYEQSPEVMSIVGAMAVLQKTTSDIVKPRKSFIDTLNIPRFQQRNLRLAVAVVDHVLKSAEREKLSNDEIEEASKTYIPGRMEVKEFRGSTVVMDGSHNQQKMAALVESMQAQYRDQSFHLLVSFGQNKQADFDLALAELRKISDRITITSFAHYQDEVRHSISLEIVELACKALNFRHVSLVADPVEALAALAGSESHILVTGSYFLLQDIRPTVFNRG